MNRACTILMVFFLICNGLLAQQTESNSTSIDSQFSEVFDRSNNYQEYKVVKRSDLNGLRKQVNDSMAALRGAIRDLSGLVAQRQARIDSLENTLQKTQADLAESRTLENGIHLFGMLLQKTTYNLIMWGIVGLLLVLLLLFIARSRANVRITREVKEKLTDLETEFEGFRQRSLEREQQIRRKLQDEINKNKG